MGEVHSWDCFNNLLSLHVKTQKGEGYNLKVNDNKQIKDHQLS